MANNALNKLAIYYFKPSVTGFADLYEEKKCPTANWKQLKPNLFTTGTSHSGQIFSKELKSTKQGDKIPWIRFINSGVADTDIFNFAGYSAFPQGLILLKLKENNHDHYFAITFGLAGESLINKDKIVHDFGIKVAMNICDPDNLKNISSSEHENITKQHERQLSIGASLYDFDLNEGSEFLRSISGQAKSGYDLIDSIKGKDNIVIKLDKNKAFDWDILTKTCLDFAQKYKSDDYKTHFEMYDKFHFETDVDLINLLDEKIATRIKQKDFSKIHLAVPDFFDYDRYSLQYKEDAEAERFSDLRIDNLFEARKITKKFSIGSLKQWKIFKFDHDSNTIVPAGWSAYKCLVAEEQHNGKTYVLSNGLWRAVSDNFLNEVQNYIKNIDLHDSINFISDIDIYDEQNKTNKESTFNEKNAKDKPDLFLMDKAKIKIAKQKKYEVCDLLSKDKKFVHVKRYSNGSASIGHLFTQAKFYADAITSDEDVRKHIITHIQNDARIENQNKNKADFVNAIPLEPENFKENEFTVVLCILIKKGALEKLEDLPFMVQYELMLSHKYLTRNRKYLFEICFVEVKLGGFKDAAVDVNDIDIDMLMDLDAPPLPDEG